MAADKPREEYSNLIPPFGSIDYTMDFDNLYTEYFKQLSYIAMRLIVFDGIPDTVDPVFFKYCILLMGKIVFFRLDEDILDTRQDAVYPLKSGDLVALNGSESNMQTIYYMHNRVLVTNPVFTKTYKLTPGKDCEIVYCTEPDRYRIFGHGGLFGLVARTATILADNDISINVAQRNTRLVNLIGADDSQTVRSVDAVMADIYSGRPYKAVQTNLIGNLQSIPMAATTSNQYLVQLIEMRQYIYSHFFESLGLQTHDNMKKERLITEEINDNEELSALSIDDILISIQEGLQRVNAMFGTNITAALNPIIQRAHEQDAAEQAEDQTDQEQAEDQTEAAAEDQTEQEQAEDQTEDAAEDQTEQEQAEDQTEDAAEDQTEAAAEDQTEQEQAKDQTEDAAEDQTDQEQAEDQTEAAAEDQTEQEQAEDQTEQEQAEDQTEQEQTEDQTEQEQTEEQTEDAAEDQTEQEQTEDQTEGAAEDQTEQQQDISIVINAEDQAAVQIEIQQPAEGGDTDG